MDLTIKINATQKFEKDAADAAAQFHTFRQKNQIGEYDMML